MDAYTATVLEHCPALAQMLPFMKAIGPLVAASNPQLGHGSSSADSGTPLAAATAKLACSSLLGDSLWKSGTAVASWLALVVGREY